MNDMFLKLQEELAEFSFCDTNFDKELLKILHYTTHPEMMPFVGKKFSDKKKILLVGESHYLDGDNIEQGNVIKEWYSVNYNSKNLVADHIFIKMMKYYYTRRVIKTFLETTNASGWGIFWQPLLAYWGKQYSKEKIQNFAFMNYYQRPAFARGSTLLNTDKDNQVAYDTLQAVIKILSPDKIIFLSVKAYKAYKSACCNKIDENLISFVAHPTCCWWNRGRGKNGREKFKGIVSEVWG